MSAGRDLDHAEPSVLAAERDALRQRIAELEAELANVPELYGRLEEALAERDRLHRECERLHAECDGLRAENVRLNGVMEATWRSFSWRLTRPLRGAKARVRR